MNRPRSSILRLMASVALIAWALGLLRSGTQDEFWIGELAPLSAIGLFGMAMVLTTSGRLRRFFGGLAVTGVVVGLAFWVGPHSFRSSVLNRVIIPIDAHFWPPGPNSITELQMLNFWAFETPETRRIRLTRSPFWSREAQADLGWLELAVAVVGGLAAAIPRPREGRQASPTDA